VLLFLQISSLFSTAYLVWLCHSSLGSVMIVVYGI